MDFKTKIYRHMLSLKSGRFTERELFKNLKIYSDFERKECKKTLETLANEGLIFYDKKSKKYNITENGAAIKGTVSGNSRGFAFILCEDKTLPDIFVASRNLHGAMHGDTVLAKIIPNNTGDSDEGEVVSVIERGTDTVVGTYAALSTYGFVEPDDRRYYADIFVTFKNNGGAKNGQKVVVKITDFPKNKKNPEGIITEILGNSGDKGTDVLSIIRSFGLYEEFDAKTLNAALKIPQTLPAEAYAKREDLRDLKIITIDGEDAKDLDDAISLSKNNDGTYRLGVHIADVSHYVKENSPIDKEAFERGTSVYFPDRVLPMLPKELSNGICSLNPNADRLTLSVIMDIDKNGRVVNSRISETVIKSSARMTYTSVTKILEGDREETEKYKEFTGMLGHMKELAEILSDKRIKRGSIDFDLPEANIIVDANGDVAEILPYPRNISNRIIEEFMILANETVAETFFEKEIPFIYRIHETPVQEKLLNFKEFLKGFGYSLSASEDIDPMEFSMLLSKIEGQPEFSVINKVMLRTMMKAKYSPENIGHFGLASEFYCHFTSPIRRYPDLMIHRVIKLFLNGKIDEKKAQALQAKVSEASLQSSEREKIAEDAEREVDDYFKAKYMLNHIGEVYEGIISGVTDFGLFVELQNTVEGMVRIESLPETAYEYIKNQYVLKGKNASYRLGGKIKIKVESVNLSAKKIDFLLA